MRHHLALRARRLRLRDGLRRYIHAARIATIRSRAATMRAVDPNIDHSAPSIRGGRGGSIDGTVLPIEEEPPTPAPASVEAVPPPAAGSSKFTVLYL